MCLYGLTSDAWQFNGARIFVRWQEVNNLGVGNILKVIEINEINVWLKTD